MLYVDTDNNTRVKQHPFSWVGYCDRFAETKSNMQSDQHDHRLFFSALKPHLIMVERIQDGQLRYKVRGQWFSTLKDARDIA